MTCLHNVFNAEKGKPETARCVDCGLSPDKANHDRIMIRYLATPPPSPEALIQRLRALSGVFTSVAEHLASLTSDGRLEYGRDELLAWERDGALLMTEAADALASSQEARRNEVSDLQNQLAGQDDQIATLQEALRAAERARDEAQDEATKWRLAWEEDDSILR